LVAAVRDYISSVTGPEVPQFEVLAVEISPLPVAVEEGAYLVLLEAISNVLRHARASSVRVTMQQQGDDLVLRVQDDGMGLAQPYISGLGITSMRSRVQALGGTFDIQPDPAKGTCLEARIQVRP
jgi:signal transduction histidine kinase